MLVIFQNFRDFFNPSGKLNNSLENHWNRRILGIAEKVISGWDAEGTVWKLWFSLVFSARRAQTTRFPRDSIPWEIMGF